MASIDSVALVVTLMAIVLTEFIKLAREMPKDYLNRHSQNTAEYSEAFLIPKYFDWDGYSLSQPWIGSGAYQFTHLSNNLLLFGMLLIVILSNPDRVLVQIPIIIIVTVSLIYLPIFEVPEYDKIAEMELVPISLRFSMVSSICLMFIFIFISIITTLLPLTAEGSLVTGGFVFFIIIIAKTRMYFRLLVDELRAVDKESI